MHYRSDREGAEETAIQVRAAGRKAIVVQADVGSEADIDRVFAEIDAAFGRINILVNNHAFQMMTKDILDIPEEQWVKTFDTNIHCKPILPHHHHNTNEN